VSVVAITHNIKMFSRAITGFKGAFHDLKRDIKSTQWLRGLGWYTGVIWTFALIAGLIAICVLPRFGNNDNACPPDRVFRHHPEKYSVVINSLLSNHIRGRKTVICSSEGDRRRLGYSTSKGFRCLCADDYIGRRSRRTILAGPRIVARI
jgi:hypothetical protein